MCMTYLAERELLEELLGLVGLAEHKVRGDLDLGPGELGRYQRLVGPEVLRIRVQSLQS